MIRKLVIASTSVLITSFVLMWVTYTFLNDCTEESLFVGESESFAQITAIVDNSEFTRSDLENYLRHDIGDDGEGEPLWLFALVSLIITIPIVAFYSGTKFLFEKIVPNTHSIVGSAASE